ncbi:MAG: hypothetical protein IPM39_29325 [Chloroflexi bacterium]|nr:hypothetical protein [Chloroflexota bacterium]
MTTNRESSLSALACALTGYHDQIWPAAGIAQRPNLEVIVTTPRTTPPISILGDWIWQQRKPGWQQPLGPIPLIKGFVGPS